MPCSSNSDCAQAGENKVCQEDSKTKEKACTKPDKSLCKDGCEAGEFCNEDGTCANIPCGTNGDCASVPGRSVCKQGKDKYINSYAGNTCQPKGKCLCEEDEFCANKNKCTAPSKTSIIFRSFINIDIVQSSALLTVTVKRKS